MDDIFADLEKTEKGHVKQTIANAVVVLDRDPVLKGVLRKNELTGKTDIVKPLLWKRSGSSSITDIDLYQIQRYIGEKYQLNNDKVINKAVSIVASENGYHPIKTYLEGLRWDGKARIYHVLAKYLGADEDDYTYEVMSLLLRACIARIYHPGCKFEIMVCLIGGQGAGKSTFFRFLAARDEWFSDDLKRIDDELVYRKMMGHWIIEMSEMLATVNAKSIEEIKSFISRQKETYKVPYETYPEDRPRQCVFVGTSNNIDFLPLDRTGNRRFAPVMVHPERVEKHILQDEDEARAYLDQVWAEAMTRYRTDAPETLKLKLSDETEKYLREMQGQFMPEDTMVGIIQEWLDQCDEDYVCCAMLYKEALGKQFDLPKQWESREIANIMNYSVKGWQPVKSHRFRSYGTQRAWRRETDDDGFRPLPEGMENPFEQTTLF